MTDLVVERLILGQGVIGSYLANRFELENVNFAILDIANQIDALVGETTTQSNVNSGLARNRNTFTNPLGMVWGRGLMMIPEEEFNQSKIPLDSKSLRRSISVISQKFLGKNIEALQAYELNGATLIDTLCIPPKIHNSFFYKTREKKCRFHDYAALSIKPTSSGYIVKAVNPSTRQTLDIQTKEVFIALGALESVRLLLNSRELFEGNETNIGRNLCDHVSMETVAISTSRVNTVSHLSPRNIKCRVYPRFLHQTSAKSDLGGFSFIDFNSKADKNSVREKVLRKASGYELSPGKSVAKTLLETERSETAFIELRSTSNNLIPKLHLQFTVTEKFLSEFYSAAFKFIEYLKSLNPDYLSDFDEEGVNQSQMFDSLHPTGVIPFLENPQVGEFGPDFQLHNHPGIYCFSTGMLPRAFSVQPTLTVIAFAENYLNHSFGPERT